MVGTRQVEILSNAAEIPAVRWKLLMILAGQSPHAEHTDKRITGSHVCQMSTSLVYFGFCNFCATVCCYSICCPNRTRDKLALNRRRWLRLSWRTTPNNFGMLCQRVRSHCFNIRVTKLWGQTDGVRPTLTTRWRKYQFVNVWRTPGDIKR